MIFLQLAEYTDGTIESENNNKIPKKTHQRNSTSQWENHMRNRGLSERALTVSIRCLMQQGFRFCRLGFVGMRKRSEPQISGRVLLELSRSFTKRSDFYRHVSNVGHPTSVHLHSGPFIQNIIQKGHTKLRKLPSKTLLSKPRKIKTLLSKRRKTLHKTTFHLSLRDNPDPNLRWESGRTSRDVQISENAL